MVRGMIVLGMIAAMVLACAAPPRPGPVELVWATGRITAAGPANDVAQLWNARHPQGPKVRVEPLPPGADEQRQLLALELGAGLPTFDVLDLDVIWTGEFADRGWLRDLGELHTELESVTLSGPLETATWDGTLWAAPYTTDAGLLYYRTDLLPGGPPATWEDLAQVARKVAAERGISPFVADGQQYEGLTVQFLEYLWGAGGQLLAPDDRTVLLPDEPTRQALTFMTDAYRTRLFADGYASTSLEDARKRFQSGGAVFMRSWPYAYRLMNDGDPASKVAGKVGIAPLPVFAGRTDARTTPALGGHNLAVSTASRWPAEATEFVRFVATSPDVQRLLAEKHSLAPTLRSTYRDLAGDPMIDLLTATLPLARPRPPSPVWPALSEEIQQQVFATYTGEQPVTATVGDLRAVLGSTVADR